MLREDHVIANIKIDEFLLDEYHVRLDIHLEIMLAETRRGLLVLFSIYSHYLHRIAMS